MWHTLSLTHLFIPFAQTHEYTEELYVFTDAIYKFICSCITKRISLPKSQAWNKIWTANPQKYIVQISLTVMTVIFAGRLISNVHQRCSLEFGAVVHANRSSSHTYACMHVHKTVEISLCQLHQQVEEYQSGAGANARQACLSVNWCQCLCRSVCVCSVCFDTFILDTQPTLSYNSDILSDLELQNCQC